MAGTPEEKQVLAEQLLTAFIEGLQKNHELMENQLEMQAEILEVLDSLGGMLFRFNMLIEKMSDKAMNGQIASPVLAPFFQSLHSVLQEIKTIEDSLAQEEDEDEDEDKD